MIGGTNIFSSSESQCERELSKYKQMFSAIILQAEKDKFSSNKEIREDAIRFLGGEDVQVMMDYIRMECE